MPNPYLPDGVTQTDLDRAIANHEEPDEFDLFEQPLPRWITNGPHCEACFGELADKDAVRCFKCGKRQHAHENCSYVVVEDYYCASCALRGALEAIAALVEENDALRKQVCREAA